MKICEHFTNVEQDCYCKMKQKVLGTIESYDGEECGKCPNRTTRTIEPLDGKFWLPDVYKKVASGAVGFARQKVVFSAVIALISYGIHTVRIW